MALFENEKLEKVNEKLAELKDKRESIANEIEEINNAMEQTFELYAIQEINEQDVEKAKILLDEKRKEYAENEEMIQKVEGVRRKVAVDSVPFVKQHRENKRKEIQSEYDGKVSEVIEARNAFMKKLAELGQVKNKIGSVNLEYNQVMNELGKEGDTYGVAIGEKTIISNGWTPKDECLGVTETDQRQAHKNGFAGVDNNE